MLLLFLCTISFVSCSDDDKQEYNLELSQNTCEVMQGYSITIDLTAHENTMLDIGDPALIEFILSFPVAGTSAQIKHDSLLPMRSSHR